MLLRKVGPEEKVDLKRVHIQKRKVFVNNVQRSKRKYLTTPHKGLNNICTENTGNFGKSIGCVGVGCERNKRIPMEKMFEGGSVSRDGDIVMARWRSDYHDLLNHVSTDISDP